MNRVYTYVSYENINYMLCVDKQTNKIFLVRCSVLKDHEEAKRIAHDYVERMSEKSLIGDNLLISDCMWGKKLEKRVKFHFIHLDDKKKYENDYAFYRSIRMLCEKVL